MKKDTIVINLEAEKLRAIKKYMEKKLICKRKWRISFRSFMRNMCQPMSESTLMSGRMRKSSQKSRKSRQK